MFNRYLDPKNDLSFKKIFGQEKHKHLPINFLNDAFKLKDNNRIIDLEFINTIQPPEIESRKESTVDVLVRDQSGNKYIIEMQIAKVEGFEKRAQFYAAKTYCAYFDKGSKYADLKKVIFLAITSYNVFPDKENYKSEHVILDNKTYEHDLKDFSFTFIELPKFTKKIEELESLEDHWYYFFKHTREDNNINELLAANPDIREAYDIVDRIHWSEQELKAYDSIWMATMDAQGAMDAAKKEGHAEGLAEGITKGIKQNQIAMAKSLLALGLLRDQIKKVTNLSDNEIAKLAAQKEN